MLAVVADGCGSSRPEPNLHTIADKSVALWSTKPLSLGNAFACQVSQRGLAR
jgi:hypothetical protein